jgi:hypothetical protein
LTTAQETTSKLREAQIGGSWSTSSTPAPGHKARPYFKNNQVPSISTKKKKQKKQKKQKKTKNKNKKKQKKNQGKKG